MSLKVSSGDFAMNSQFVQDCKTGNWSAVEKTATLWWRMFNKMEMNEGFVEACYHGQTETVGRLLKWANPRYETDKSLRMAVREGHIECVKLLLPHVPATTCDSVCAFGAAQRGQLDMLKLLLPLSEPHINPNIALAQAAKYGHTDLVQWLLTIANPYYKESLALRNALKNGHAQVAELLMPRSNCKSARAVMVHNKTYDPQGAHLQLEQFIEMHTLRQKLDQATSDVQAPTIKRKM